MRYPLVFRPLRLLVQWIQQELMKRWVSCELNRAVRLPLLSVVPQESKLARPGFEEREEGFLD